MDAQGYDESRFIGRPVRKELICGICRDVVNDPRCCQNKEHPFCFACITRYLQNPETQECPVCRQHLTPETLKHPGRFFMICLSELKIMCDYIDRGCPDHILLGNLQHHVNNCGFAPVKCEKCDMEINRKDKDNHDKRFCQLGGAKCQDCGNIKASQDEMKAELYHVKARQNQMMETLDATKTNQELMMITLTEILNDQRGDKLMENIGKMSQSQDEMRQSQEEMRQSQEEMRQSQEEMRQSQEEMKAKQGNIERQMEGMKRKQDQIDDNVNEIKEKVDVIEKVLRSLPETTNEINQNVTKMSSQIQDQAFPGCSSSKQEIILMGGYKEVGHVEALSSVSVFNLVDGKCVRLSLMGRRRAAAASCVYNNDVFITGGNDGHGNTDSIQILKLNESLPRWTTFDGKLPDKLSCHDVTIYQDKLYIFGGENGNKISDAIYELSLIPPYTAKLLARMPQPRMNHRAELINGKVYIFGGRKDHSSLSVCSSVVVYDIIKNECEIHYLECPVYRMSTVTWGNSIIIIGGNNKNGQVLNDVIMYDTVTGEKKILPSLEHSRDGASAVVVHDAIVVLGGEDDEQTYLNSVESYKMGDKSWKQEPGIDVCRYLATAVVNPLN